MTNLNKKCVLVPISQVPLVALLQNFGMVFFKTMNQDMYVASQGAFRRYS